MSPELALYLVAPLFASVTGVGVYWAKRTDSRLERLEQKESDLKERLARVEEKIDILIELHRKS